MRGRSQRYKDITTEDVQRWLALRKQGKTLQRIAALENVDFRKVWKATTLMRSKSDLPRSIVTTGKKSRMIKKLKNIHKCQNNKQKQNNWNHSYPVLFVEEQLK